jgi:hypothetical protein
MSGCELKELAWCCRAHNLTKMHVCPTCIPVFFFRLRVLQFTATHDEIGTHLYLTGCMDYGIMGTHLKVDIRVRMMDCTKSLMQFETDLGICQGWCVYESSNDWQGD